MNKFFSTNLHLIATIAVLSFAGLSTPDACAKSLYKSVNADGKVTYSNHPTVASQNAQNISMLKNSARFSLAGKAVRSATKS